MKQPISFNITIGVYGVDINFYIGNISSRKGFKRFNRIIPKKRRLSSFKDSFGAKGHCILQPKGCSDIYIYQADGTNNEALVDTLCTLRHEVQHACTHIFNWIQAGNKALQQEPFFYLNDLVFTEAASLICKSINKSKKAKK